MSMKFFAHLAVVAVAVAVGTLFASPRTAPVGSCCAGCVAGCYCCDGGACSCDVCGCVCYACPCCK